MTEEKSKEAEGGQTGAPDGRKKVVRRVNPDEKLPFTSHLEEFRWRLIYCLVTVGVAFALLYGVSDQIFLFIKKPIGVDLVFLAPAEAFFVYLKLALYMAVIVSMPVILYHTWEFVAPGLLDTERRFTGLFVVFGVLFFAAGAAFCYFVVLPYGLKFLIAYGGEGLKPMISVGNYISFVFMFLLAFGLIFEMPLVIVFVTRLGITTPEWFAKQRSYFVVGNFVVAAILTPTPDVVSQLMMAVPMMFLFELGIIAAKILRPRKNREAVGNE
ncbi:MAG: twin-arginine translocase subunit TatC [Nitrospinae bacterium]|nr:twin-arginine translocase subunit TatC [Nitrospinota bacterium]